MSVLLLVNNVPTQVYNSLFLFFSFSSCIVYNIDFNRKKILNEIKNIFIAPKGDSVYNDLSSKFNL